MIANITDNYILFLLILIRMSGAILVNPLFGRKNVPNLVKAGMTLVLAVALTSSAASAPEITSVFDFFFKAVYEFAIGYAVSLIMYMAFSAILVAADQIDMQIGIAMSKIYDPGSGVSSPVTGSIFYAFMILLFFATNGHITLYKLLADTITAIPVGTAVSIAKASYVVVGVLGSTLTLALKLAFPIIAIEFITEMGLGILTRSVSHINIFSAGIQLKLIVGLIVLVLMAPYFGNFCDTLYSMMFSNITSAMNSVTLS